MGLPTWLTIPDSQFAHEQHMTDTWDSVPLTAHYQGCDGRREPYNQGPYSSIKRNIKWGIFRGVLSVSLDFLAKDQRREAISTISWCLSSSVAHLQPTGVQILQLLAGLALPAARLEGYIPSLLLLLLFPPQTFEELTPPHYESTGIVNFYIFIQSLQLILLGSVGSYIKIKTVLRWHPF